MTTFPHRHPPQSHRFRQVVVDTFGIPPAMMDADTVRRIKGTFAYQVAELRDSSDGLWGAIRKGVGLGKPADDLGDNAR